MASLSFISNIKVAYYTLEISFVNFIVVTCNALIYVRKLGILQ
jgi:hypothetical protein